MISIIKLWDGKFIMTVVKKRNMVEEAFIYVGVKKIIVW
jgi:hypothetical protein